MMALKTKQDNLPEEFETTEETQVSFDDLEYEAEFVDEDELKPKRYYTISGKEQQYEPTWERYDANDLDVDNEFEGRPELSIYDKPEKSYNAIRVRTMDDGEILDVYFNFPKKDWPYVKNINKEFEFYRPLFNFIFAVLRLRDERNVVDKDGEEVNKFKSVNLETFAKYVDQMDRIGIRITEGNNGYNDWIIYKME